MKFRPRATYLLVVVAALCMAAFAFTLGAAWETRDLVFAGAIVAAGFLARVSGAVPWLQRFWQGQLVVFRRHALPLAVVVLLLLWLFVYLAMDIFISVKPGQGGVLWKRFGGGTVTDVVYGEGLHMIPPWDIMYIYDLRYQQQSKEFEVLSSDGLLYSVELTVRYRLRPELLGHFHKCVGPDYVDTMLLPEVGAVTRLVTAQLTPEELYTSKRQASEAEIATRLRLEVAGCAPRDEQNAGTAKGLARTGRYFDASEVFIRRVVLPPKVAEAVESKLAQRQQMLEYDYRIDKERKEAQRKVIEAHGIQAFHEIVNQGMSSAMLQWHGIDAILELAKSPNSKVVLIGSNDKGGLPLLFGSLAAADSPASAPGGANTASPARPHGGLPGLPQTTH